MSCRGGRGGGGADTCEPARTGMLLVIGTLPPVLQVMSAVVKSCLLYQLSAQKGGEGGKEGEHTGTGPLSLYIRVYRTGFGVMYGSENGSQAGYDTPPTMMVFRYPWARTPGASRIAARMEVQCMVKGLGGRERKKQNSAHPGVLYRCGPLDGELRWWGTYIGYSLKLPSGGGDPDRASGRGGLAKSIYGFFCRKNPYVPESNIARLHGAGFAHEMGGDILTNTGEVELCLFLSPRTVCRGCRRIALAAPARPVGAGGRPQPTPSRRMSPACRATSRSMGAILDGEPGKSSSITTSGRVLSLVVVCSPEYWPMIAMSNRKRELCGLTMSVLLSIYTSHF